MKRKILAIALVGAGVITTLALKPAMATESCPLQSNYQNSYQSDGYVQVKGGRHHSRGVGQHRNDYYQTNRRQHRGGNHSRGSHDNAWYIIDGVLRQLENHHRGGRHHSNGQHHSSSYYHR